uniref:Canopy FGF signaling regulator 1 n=1 Tax=Anas platyrhynchos TaxID=8839 RepID=A0A8B9QK98_ANAPL
ADEALLYDIKKVNPKRAMDVGSFQVNPDGTQERSKVPLAKSEGDLAELLENPCAGPEDGQLRVEPPTQTRRVERFAARQEEKIWADFKKFWGESLVEEPEDEIFSLIAQEADYLADKLCSEKSGTVNIFYLLYVSLWSNFLTCQNSTDRELTWYI